MSTRAKVLQRQRRSRIPLTMSAFAAVMLPDEAFAFFASEPWQTSILRSTLLAGVSVVAVWPWVLGEGGEVMVRLKRWVYVALPVVAYYLIWSQALFLVIGFSLIVGTALDMWASRAHAASERLRARLSDS